MISWVVRNYISREANSDFVTLGFKMSNQSFLKFRFYSQENMIIILLPFLYTAAISFYLTKNDEYFLASSVLFVCSSHMMLKNVMKLTVKRQLRRCPWCNGYRRRKRTR